MSQVLLKCDVVSTGEGRAGVRAKRANGRKSRRYPSACKARLRRCMKGKTRSASARSAKSSRCIKSFHRCVKRGGKPRKSK